MNAIAIVEPAQKEVIDTDAFETPTDVYEALSKRWGPYVLDVAASAENAKCEYFITKEEDARKQDWFARASGGPTWNNPPYSQPNLPEFMGRARLEAEKGLTVTCWVPATPEAEWFQDHVFRGADLLDMGIIPHGPIAGHWMRMTRGGANLEVIWIRGRKKHLMGGKPTKHPPLKGNVAVTFYRR